MFKWFKRYFTDGPIEPAIPTFADGPHEAHKRRFYEIDTIQAKMGITNEDIEKAEARRVEGQQHVYLCTYNGINQFISKYE